MLGRFLKRRGRTGDRPAQAPPNRDAPVTRSPEIAYHLLTAVSRAQAQGHSRQVRRYGFSRAQAEQLARLPSQELHRLTHPALGLFDIQVDPDALDAMLERHTQRVRQRELQDRLLALGAPAELMRELFGWSSRDCARRRRELDIAGLDTGRPRRPSRVEVQAIWQAWRDHYGLAPAEHLVAVADATGIKLNVIWGLTRDWTRDAAHPAPQAATRRAAAEETGAPWPRDLRGWWDRLTQRPDREHWQALIRVCLASGLFAYVWFTAPLDARVAALGPPWRAALPWVGLGSVVGALALVAAIAFWPQPRLWRRYLALGGDLLVVSFYLWYQGDYGALQYVVYLWVIFGHGVRYGQHHLYVAAALAAAAFLAITAVHPYWAGLGMLPYPLALGLLLLPIWIDVLLRSQRRSQRLALARRLGGGAGIRGRPGPPRSDA